MEGPRAVRRRQLANLYQAGNEDTLLRRRRPRNGSSKPATSKVSREKDMVRREKEKALYGSIADTIQFGQRRPWHYGYRNQPGLSGSAPLAAASRYGAIGTLRMIRRDASASRGGTAHREDESAEDFQVDEWSPMLRCSTAPSLATTTTPKAWPESAMYPHGSQTKRMQPSPWYDGETTANTIPASTAGPGMRRVAAGHGFIMSILERDAVVENKRPTSATGVGEGSRSPRSGRASSVHVRTPKRMDQDTGFLSGGVYFTAPKDPLRHGLHAALANKLVRQTELDGLKWHLLKQILRVITGSQHGLPLEAVQGVAATFGRVVGTSKLATKAQFVDHITGKHEGFPESELATLFDFFASPMAPGSTTTTSASSKKSSHGPPGATQPGDSAEQKRDPSCRRLSNKVSRGGAGSGGGGVRASSAQGADWTLAVACLRLLARPKEPVMEAVLGVFDVLSRARGDRARHRRRLEQERVEKERQVELGEERERWKRRRRRQQEGGIVPSVESLNGPEPRARAGEASAPQGLHAGGGDYDARIQGEKFDLSSLNRVSFTETARVFSLVCSNDQERHSVATTYRHRFRLELRAVIQEVRNPGHGKDIRSPGGGGSGHASSNIDGRPPSPEMEISAGESDPRQKSFASRVRTEAVAKGALGEGDRGLTAKEFSEALMRCPEMLEAFGSQLVARFRHRHRPIWMAPFSRKGS